ncbi:MAG: winged helix-turn-helix domain-containing protein [Candidatus Pacearchaeota archaeon]|jgi:DNA-binding PadR family transcriptional regulator
MNEIRQLSAFILTSKIRRKVLQTLAKKDMRQIEIAKIIKEKQPNISKALYELEKKNLVICLTPEKKAWKVYGITELGKQTLKNK